MTESRFDLGMKVRKEVDMGDKRRSLKEAIAEYVQDDLSVAIEGFTAFICFAAGHEIIRQRRRNLTLIRMTPDVIYDQMVAAGVAHAHACSVIWATRALARYIACAAPSKRAYQHPLQLKNTPIMGWWGVTLWRIAPAFLSLA